MHFWFWKHNDKKDPVIIAQDHFDKLPEKHQKQFGKYGKAPHGSSVQTHEIKEYDDDFLLVGIIAAENIALSATENHTWDDVNGSQPPSDQGFGGGDGGGAGAGGSFAPDNAPTSDLAPDTQTDSTQGSGNAGGGDGQ